MPKSIFRTITAIFVVSLVGILLGCGGGGGTVGPSPTPTPSGTPIEQLQKTIPFLVTSGIVGMQYSSPFNNEAGTYRFVARWEPAPPEGQIFLLVIDEGSYASLCFYNLECPQIRAKDISPSMPKEVRIHLAAQERIYVWVRPVSGASVSGTIDMWFRPDK